MIRIYPSSTSIEVLRTNNWASFVPYEGFFQKHNLQYSQESGDMALIMQGDDNALLAAKETVHYPYDMVVALLRKDTLSTFMATYGFNALETKRIYSVADIVGFSNFIVKPLISTGGRSVLILGETPNFITQQVLGSDEIKSPLRFTSVDDLLVGRDSAAVDASLANGYYCIQQAVMSDNFEQVTISGTVNGNGDVYFRRNATWVFESGVMTKQHRERSTYAAEQALLATMLSPVRNAAFGVQFIVLDGKLYPIDWNFRDPGRTVKAEQKLAPVEFEQALAHQFDIPHDKVLENNVWDTVMTTGVFDKDVHTVREPA